MEKLRVKLIEQIKIRGGEISETGINKTAKYFETYFSLQIKLANI